MFVHICSLEKNLMLSPNTLYPSPYSHNGMEFFYPKILSPFKIYDMGEGIIK